MSAMDDLRREAEAHAATPDPSAALLSLAPPFRTPPRTAVPETRTMTTLSTATVGKPSAQRDDRPSSRDYRRTLAILLPQPPAFRNPAARLLAEFADAVASQEGWEAFAAAHPDAGDVLSTEPDR